MARFTLCLILSLFTFQGFGQTKKSEPYSLSSTYLEYDSLLLEAIIGDPNAHKISNDIYLISDLAETQDFNGSELCYRKNKTIWYCIHLNYNQVELDSSNLDSFGKKELILKCFHCEYGSGGSSCQGAFIVLNIDDTPIQLMNAIDNESEEAFSRTYGTDTIPSESYTIEYERKIRLENNSIVVYPNTINNLNEFLKVTGKPEIGITQIPSGTYKLINGQLKRIKK